MQIEWLRKEATSHRLILIFPGWSTTPSFYRSLVRDGWDMAVVYDYTSLLFPREVLRDYATVYVYAWSLGVFAASVALQDEDFTAAFAICGTEMPVSEDFGIPEAIFRGTREGLSERNLAKFRRRMVSDSAEFRSLTERLGDSVDDINLLQAELLAIESASASRPASKKLRWSRAYIPVADHIIPVESQKRYWATRPEIPATTISSHHLPDFEAILRSTIPDLVRVGHHFRQALDSYDSHASAQSRIARRLASLIAAKATLRGGSILELGQGSGLFSRIYAPMLAADSIEYVDLYPSGPFGLAQEETVIEADAETWLPLHREPLRDYILSASCLQWFINPAAFFAETAASLKEGGIFAFSTFLPGNLRQLDSLRPTPLSYPSAEMLTNTLRLHFSEVETASEDIDVDFDTVREAMLHLRNTGVKGGMKMSAEGSKIRDSLYEPSTGKYRLTYVAFYAVCRK